MYCSAFQAIGQSGTTTIKKISVKAESTRVSAISFGSSLPDGAFDQGDHPVEERFARAGRDAHDDPIGEHDGAAGDAGAVAAGFANDRGRFAGNGGLIDRGDPFDDLSVAGNDLSRLDDDAVARSQVRRRHLLDRRRPQQAIGDGVATGPVAATRPAPCRAPRPGPWQSSQTARSGRARRPAR